MPAQLIKTRTRLGDGRCGEQYAVRNSDGTLTLTEIVIDRKADGSTCREVYGPRRHLHAGVFAFSDLGNVTWTSQ